MIRKLNYIVIFIVMTKADLLSLQGYIHVHLIYLKGSLKEP